MKDGRQVAIGDWQIQIATQSICKLARTEIQSVRNIIWFKQHN